MKNGESEYFFLVINYYSTFIVKKRKLRLMRNIIIILLVASVTPLLGQSGGEGVYNFLKLPTSARVSGLGGAPVSLIDNDMNLVVLNPALLTDTMDLSLITNYSLYMEDAKNSYIGFAKSWKGVGNFAVGMHYLNYGTFEGYDRYGVPTSTFTGSDMALYLQYSRKLSKHVSGGITIKPIFSQLENYSSNGLVADIGFNYSSLSRNSSLGVTLRNYGRQFTNYDNSTTYSVDPDLSIAFSQRLAHAPLRLLVTAQNLLNWDLTYQVTDTENGKATTSESYSTGNKLLRHMVFGVEIIPSRNFWIDLAYNGRTRAELKTEVKPGLTGFSGGFGLRIKQFQFGYALSVNHLSAVTNSFGLTANFKQFTFAQKRTVQQ